jgi:RimJ/RimL family protein N-acetyltransferase
MSRMVRSLEDLEWPIRTERLVVRRWTEPDVEVTWAYRRLAEVTMWMTSAPATLEEYRALYDEDRRGKTLVVELAPGGPVVGDLMVWVKDGWAQRDVADRARGVEAELGWCLDPAYAGRGYASEAVAGMVDACFAGLGLRRVTAQCFAGNERSWRLMERLGMRREEHNVRDSLHRTLGWVDGVAYALLVDEWVTSRPRQGRRARPAADARARPPGT